MNPLTLLKLLLLLFSCGLCGALGGYYAASFSPIPAQIAIVDIQSLVKKAMENNATQTEDDAKALTARVKATTDKLVQQGVVVWMPNQFLMPPRKLMSTLNEHQPLTLDLFIERSKSFGPILVKHIKTHAITWVLLISLYGVIHANYRLAINQTPSLPYTLFLI